MFYVPSSFAIILMRKRELVALLSLSSWYLVIVVLLFLAVLWFVCSLWLCYFLIILTYYFYWCTIETMDILNTITCEHSLPGQHFVMTLTQCGCDAGPKLYACWNTFYEMLFYLCIIIQLMHSFEVDIRIFQPKNWCSPRRIRGEHHFRLTDPDVNWKRMQQLFCYMTLSLFS